MSTLVTGFINLYNYDNDYSLKSFQTYLEKSKPLLELPLNKIIFLEKNTLEYIDSKFINNYNTFIPFEKEEIVYWKYRDSIKNCKLPKFRNINKDTHDYILIQLQKTEWIKKAIELNPYESSQFAWIDFGIFHIINNIDIFNTVCNNITNKYYNSIRIPGCWNLSYNYDVYNNIAWYFCGGFFGGDKEYLVKFANLVFNKTLELIKKNILIWEVNIWYLVYLENKHLFDWYYGDHNISMLQNY